MARHFHIGKSDLIEKYVEQRETPSILQEITDTTSKLEEPRQKIVFTIAQEQLKGQEATKVIPLRKPVISEERLNEGVQMMGTPRLNTKKNFFKI